MYPIGSVYFTVNNTNPSSVLGGGTWELIGDKLAVKENVYGNGYTLALTNGSTLGGLTGGASSGYNAYNGLYGKLVNTYENGSYFGAHYSLGVPTKTQLSNNPEYSGLIVDTETIYSWKRTA